MRRKVIRKETKHFADGNIIDALMRRAVGYTTEETTEEYSVEDGKFVLVKRKVATKEHPPDLSAITVALEVMSESQKSLSDLTDEELLEEKKKLLEALKESETKQKGVLNGQLSMETEEEEDGNQNDSG